MSDTPAARAPDLSDQLALFNEMRREWLNGIPPTPERPMPLEPTGVGGDVGGPE